MQQIYMLPLQFSWGLLLGYVTVSLAESFLHKNVQHARRRLRRRIAKCPGLGAIVRRGQFSHSIVHHGLTYRESHVQQFRSAEEQDRVDHRIRRHTANERIIRERYGVSLSVVGVLFFVAPVLPVYAMYMLVLPTWAKIGTLVPFVAYPSASAFLHPYLHMPRTEALRTASKPIRWLLNTKYVRFISRHHYVHHQRIHCNYNLLWLGDYLLGCHRTPSREEIRAMKEKDVIC